MSDCQRLSRLLPSTSAEASAEAASLRYLSGSHLLPPIQLLRHGPMPCLSYGILLPIVVAMFMLELSKFRPLQIRHLWAARFPCSSYFASEISLSPISLLPFAPGIHLVSASGKFTFPVSRLTRSSVAIEWRFFLSMFQPLDGDHAGKGATHSSQSSGPALHKISPLSATPQVVVSIIGGAGSTGSRTSLRRRPFPPIEMPLVIEIRIAHSLEKVVSIVVIVEAAWALKASLHNAPGLGTHPVVILPLLISISIPVPVLALILAPKSLTAVKLSLPSH